MSLRELHVGSEPGRASPAGARNGAARRELFTPRTTVLFDAVMAMFAVFVVSTDPRLPALFVCLVIASVICGVPSLVKRWRRPALQLDAEGLRLCDRRGSPCAAFSEIEAWAFEFATLQLRLSDGRRLSTGLRISRDDRALLDARLRSEVGPPVLMIAIDRSFYARIAGTVVALLAFAIFATYFWRD